MADDYASLDIINYAPNRKDAQNIIDVVMRTVDDFTAKWVKTYDELDDMFLRRAFDIAGFQSYQFLDYGLKKHNRLWIKKA